MSGGGRWTDSKDGTESASSNSSQTAGSWNIDVFVDVVKELVRVLCSEIKDRVHFSYNFINSVT